MESELDVAAARFGDPASASAPQENRRGLRPADEYRDVSTDEWGEFEEHFAKRKIAIGDCMRAYATSCVHEYACEQCKLARPDVDAQPRLERTRQGRSTRSTKPAGAAGSARSSASNTSSPVSRTSSPGSNGPVAASRPSIC